MLIAIRRRVPRLPSLIILKLLAPKLLAPKLLAPRLLAVTLLVLAAETAARAAEPTPDQIRTLFGVAPGETTADVDLAAARHGVSCRAPSPRSVVCSPPASAIPVRATASFWVENDAIDRIYVMAALAGNELGPAVAAFDALRERAEQVLGPAVRVADWPVLFGNLGDSDRVDALLAGHAHLERSWPGELATVRLWLGGENGRLVVVMGVRGPGKRLDCSQGRIASRLMELFPPAPAETRAIAARHLALCKVDRASGALDAALADPALRRQAVAGEPGAPAAPTAAQATSAQTEMVRSLARLGARDIVRQRLDDPAQPGPVRAEALRQLEVAGTPPSPQVIESAQSSASPALAAAAREVLQSRQQLEIARAQQEQERLQEAERLRREAEARRAEASRLAEQRRIEQEQRQAERQRLLDQARRLTDERRAEEQKLAEARRQATARRQEQQRLERERRATARAKTPAAPSGYFPGPPNTPSLTPPTTEPPVPLPPPPPPKPTGPRDGTALAVASSTVAGAALMRNLALLGMSSNLGAELLLGSAGAVIGGGTAWGLARFGLRPTLAQAAWFTNVSAWGTLAGALAYAGSGADNYKLQYGSLVLGEVVGMSVGAWSAHRWRWTAQQMVLANSLVLGAGLAAAGASRIMTDDTRIGLTSAIGTVPAMLAASIVARAVDPTTDDLHLIGVISAGAGWEGALLASGATGTSLFGSRQGQGGLALGLGAGYLAAVGAAHYVEVPPRRLYLGTGGLLAGNALGYGIHRALTGFQYRDAATLPPDRGAHWAFGAGLGGLAAGMATLAYLPHARLGPRYLDMSVAGALYGGLTWYLASDTAAIGTNSQAVADVRLGGTIAGTIAGAAAGLIASRHFAPDGVDQATTAAASVAGLSAGLGLATLASENPDVHGVGLAAGTAFGFASGALLSHYSRLREPDVSGAVLGAGQGMLVGLLAPSLASTTWSWDRQSRGGLLLGLGAGALTGAGVAHATGASHAQVRVTTIAAGLGLGMGAGAGMMWSDENHAVRVGVVAGSSSMLLLSALAEHRLHLADGLGPAAPSLGLFGASLGATYGYFAADTATPEGRSAPSDRQRLGATLLGASAGLTSGLVLSKWVDPSAQGYGMALGGSLIGRALGAGTAGLAFADADRRRDGVLALGGTFVGLVGGATASHFLELRPPDVAASFIGAGYGTLFGALATNLGHPGQFDRQTWAGMELGVATGALGGLALSHGLQATPGQVTATGVAGLLGMGMGLGAGLTFDDRTWPQATRIGVLAGGAGLMTAQLLAERRLRLGDGLGPHAPEMGTMGALIGAGFGWFDSDLAGPRDGSEPSLRQRGGAALLGGTAGLATGLVLSTRLDPDISDYAKVLGGMLLGRSLGLGLANLRWDETDYRRDGAFALVGTGAGLVGGALAARYVDFTGPDIGAGIVGAAYGTLWGALAANLGAEPASTRRTAGGAEVGVAAGTIGAVALSHGLHADGGDVTLTTTAGLLGMGMGLGAGLMMPTDDYRAARIGTLAGGAGLVGLQLASERWLHLRRDLHSSAFPMSLFGAAMGATYGYYAADIAAPDATTEPSSRQRKGGALLGGAAGLSTGIVLSKWLEPRAGAYGMTLAGSLIGRATGQGIAGLVYGEDAESDIRRDGAWALGGTLVGALGGALAANAMELRPPDVGGMFVGAGYGAIFGALAPSLNQPDWANQRRTVSGADLGGAMGALAGTALAHSLHATGRQVATTMTAGILGMGIGAGAGLASLTPTSQGARVGVVAGGAGLMAAQMLAERKLRLADGVGPNAGAISMVGMLIGAGEGWVASGLVHDANHPEIRDRQTAGAILAGSTAGLTTGLVLSRWLTPGDNDYAFVGAGNLAGHGLGAGMARLLFSGDERRDAALQLGGSLIGLASAGIAAHRLTLRSADLGAGVLGAAYGSLFGALAPSFGKAPASERRTLGGAEVGAAAGFASAVGLAHALDSTGAQNGVVGLAGLLGMGFGTGVGMVWPQPNLQPLRIGVVAGGASFMAAAMLAEHRLHLADGLGPAAGGMGLFGATMGTIVGARGARAFYRSGVNDDRQGVGGALAGATAGLTAGLAASKGFEPAGLDYATTTLTALAGAELGMGLADLAFDASSPQRDAGFELAGSLAGLAGGMAAAHWLQLRTPDLAAGLIGGAYGILLGQGLPNLGRDPASDRRTLGGVETGFAVGALSAATASYLTQASGGQIAVPTLAGMLGIGAGYGTGMLIANDESGRPVRVGGFVGPLAFAGAALVLDRRLHLSEGLPARASGFAAAGVLYGAIDGYLLAGAVSENGYDGAHGARRGGGVLAGASFGTALGLALSKPLDLGAADFGVISGGKLMGGLFGAGVGLLASTSDSTPVAGAFAGSLLGMTGAMAMQRLSPIDELDLAGSAVGLGWGALVGTLLPNLRQPNWDTSSRLAAGGALAGIGGGALAGAALRHTTKASGTTVGLAALGAADGLMAGVGVGLMTAADSGTRWGAVVGSSAGLALGAAVWPHLELGPGDGALITSAAALGAWNGAWLPVIGHARLDDVAAGQPLGGLMAGAGIGIAAGSLLAPLIDDEDHDLLTDALTLDVLWTGAGAGIGALASARADAPIIGMLGGGAAGLLLGGSLHRRIEASRSVPMLALAGVEGVWFGAWLPYALREPGMLRDGDRLAAFAAGAFGGLGLATVLSAGYDMSARDAGVAGTTSAIGASLGGGAALLAGSSLSTQAKVGTMLGGTGLGLVGGALLAPHVDFRNRGVRTASLGALLGGSEGLVFAWAGRSATAEEFAGAGLVGMGVGASLGLASAANPQFTASLAPGAAGFAAWGAWMGSWSGALVRRSPQEIVFGGLVGTDIGFAAGYGLLRSGLVEPRDFGWLSLFGALGTVVGAGLGTSASLVISTSTPEADRRPIWIGLAAGPAVGMAVGGLVLPRLRAFSESMQSASLSFRSIKRAFGGVSLTPDLDAPQLTLASPEVLPSDAGHSFGLRAGRWLRSIVDVTEWAPMAGALPTTPDVPGPPPFLIGVTGLFK